MTAMVQTTQVNKTTKEHRTMTSELARAARRLDAAIAKADQARADRDKLLVLALRDEGMTYEAVGNALGISKAGVAKIANAHGLRRAIVQTGS